MSVYAYTFAETLLKIENVCLSFNGRPVLRDVCAEIKNVIRPGHSQGQVVGFLGPSGIGKTQLFRILAGLNRPSSGQVLITEKFLPVAAGTVGVVAQNYLLFDHRTVFSNLLKAGEQAGLRGRELKEKASVLLERFKLLDHAEHYPAQLSGGQRQRVAIAQQLMCSQHFLLMDEPFSGLDPLMKDEACELITEVAAMDELATIVVITHDIGSAIQVSDTLWLMGRDRDAEGNIVPGARIQESYNLMDRGLAWRPNITALPEFAQCLRDVRERFQTL